eukprot:9490559-Pyramimonas_sp.AAC.1
MSDCHGAPVALIRGVEVPGMVLWRDSGSPGRKSDGDPRRQTPRNGVLAQLRIYGPLFSNGAFPS